MLEKEPHKTEPSLPKDTVLICIAVFENKKTFILFKNHNNFFVFTYFFLQCCPPATTDAPTTTTTQAGGAGPVPSKL